MSQISTLIKNEIQKDIETIGKQNYHPTIIFRNGNPTKKALAYNRKLLKENRITKYLDPTKFFNADTGKIKTIKFDNRYKTPTVTKAFKKKYELIDQVYTLKKTKPVYISYTLNYWVKFVEKGKNGQVYRQKKNTQFSLDNITNKTPQSVIDQKAKAKKNEILYEEDQQSAYRVIRNNTQYPIELNLLSKTTIKPAVATFEFDLNNVSFLNMDGFAKETWNTNTNRCVYDWIIHRYGDIKGCKKICNYKTLYYIFNNVEKQSKIGKEEEERINNFFNLLSKEEVEKRLEDKNYLFREAKMIWGAGDLLKQILLDEDEADKVVKSYEDYQKKFWGVSPKQIQRFCEYLRIPHYCLNNDDKIIHYYYPKEKNTNKYPVMVYKASNKHLYPITDEKKIKSIGQISSELTQQQKKTIADKKAEDTEQQAIIKIEEVFNSNDKIAFMIDKMREKQIQVINKNVSMTGENLNSFILEDTKYIFIDTGEDKSNNAKKYCELNDIEYNGQTLVSIGKNLLEENITLKSKCNYLVNDILLTDKVKFRTHLGFMNDYTMLDINEECKAYDISKCYSKCITDPFENFITFNYNSIPLEYKGGKIVLGLYYVETNDTTLFHLNNIYSTSIVKYGINEGIIKPQNIKWYIPASRKHKKTTFLELFDTYSKNCKGEVGINKLLNNLTTGLLGGNKFRKTQFSCSLDLNDAFNYITDYQDNKCFLRQYKEVSVFGHKIERDLEEHNIPIYIQILDDSNIRLYELMKEATNNKIENVIYRKTDCVVVQEPNKNIQLAIDQTECELCNKLTCNSGYYIHKEHGEVEGIICKYCFGHTIDRSEYHDWKKAVSDAKDNNWGDYREEDLPERYISCDYSNRIPDIKKPNFEIKYNKYDINDSSDYKNILELLKEKGGLMVNGSAGTGKSYVINKIAEEYGQDKVAKLCFTNKGAINIGGKTIHKFLGLNQEGKISQSRLSNIKKFTELIIIDEVSMVSSELWARLHLIHRETQIPFLLVGDWKQIPPVEDLDYCEYLNHPIVVDLSKKSLIELTKVYRYDTELKKASENVMKLNINKYGKAFTKKNICYTNLTRKFVNKTIVDKLIDQNNIKDTYFINKREIKMKKGETKKSYYERYSKEPTQNIRIFNGMPIIASKTHNQGDICVNNEEFIITKIDDKELEAVSQRPDGSHSITIPTKDFYAYFLVAYCITTHKAQGSTIKDKITIWDWDIMDEKLRYTALTRATKNKDINFVKTPAYKTMINSIDDLL